MEAVIDKEPSNADIMLEIGKLVGGFESINNRLDRADESRKVIYEKLDEQNKAISDVKFAVKTAAGIAVQARDEVKLVATRNSEQISHLENKLSPLFEQWKAMNTLGKVIVAFLSIGGASIFAGVLWFGSMITKAIQHWLGIPPT